MKKIFESVALIIIAVLAAAIVSVAIYHLFYAPGATGGSSLTNSFIAEPVVDIIIPLLFKQSSEGGVNSPLNLTRGQTEAIEIEVFPTVNVDVKMSLAIYALPGGSNSSRTISGSFDPVELSIFQNGEGKSTLTIQISSIASISSYSAIVTAANTANSSQTWDDIFPLNVTG